MTPVKRQYKVVTKPSSQNHYVFTLILVALAVAGTIWYMKEDQDRYRRALEETVRTQFATFGAAAQAQGHVVNYDELVKRAKAEIAPELMTEIRRTNGTLTSLSVAIAKVEGKIEGLKPPTVFTRDPDGSFKTTLEQSRGALPPLTSLELDYNAKDPNPKTALKGNWKPYTENFDLKFLKWTGAEGGFRTAAQLERSVTDDKGIQIGQKETIPIKSNEAYFLKDDLQRLAPAPKYSIFVGASVDTRTGKKSLAVIGDKYITRNFSITSGYVNGGALLGGRFTFGKQ